MATKKKITREDLKTITPLKACLIVDRALRLDSAYFLMVSHGLVEKDSVGLRDVLKAAIRNGRKNL